MSSGPTDPNDPRFGRPPASPFNVQQPQGGGSGVDHMQGVYQVISELPYLRQEIRELNEGLAVERQRISEEHDTVLRLTFELEKLNEGEWKRGENLAEIKTLISDHIADCRQKDTEWQGKFTAMAESVSSRVKGMDGKLDTAVNKAEEALIKTQTMVDTTHDNPWLWERFLAAPRWMQVFAAALILLIFANLGWISWANVLELFTEVKDVVPVTIE